MNILFFLKPKNETTYIKQTDTVRQALEKMEKCGYTSVPMIDREGKYVGTVSEGDFLWTLKNRFNVNLKEMEKLSVTELDLRRYNEPIGIHSDIEDLFITASNQNFVPVVDDNGVFIGIITRRDILDYAAAKLFASPLVKSNLAS